MLWWRLFQLSVQVLRSEQHSLREFRESVDLDGIAPKAGKRKKELVAKAMETASAQLAGQVPERTLPRFIDFFEQKRALVVKGGANADAARLDLQGLQPIYGFCGQVCLSAFLQLRFGRLMVGLTYYLPPIIACLLVFTWSANPSKEGVTLLDKPEADAAVLASPKTKDALIAAQVSGKCLGMGAHALKIATGPKSTVIYVLIPPETEALDCKPRRITLASDQFVGID